MSRQSPASTSVSIDFGTSNTVVSIRRADGRVQQQLFDGSPQLPSAVHLGAEGEIDVGVDAVHSGWRHPDRSEPHPKRRVDDGTILLGESELPVSEVLGAVLGRARTEITQSVGELGPVAVTVPATWGPTRRHVIADAAESAGLGAVTLVAEPVAAATYFVSSLGNEVPPGSGVVVYDLGGGTFDATVLRLGPAGFEVLAVDGADDLGGIDFDHALLEHLAATVRPDDERWRRLTAPGTPADRRHRIALLEEVRRAKERLSRQTTTELTIGLLDADVHLTRDELEAVALPLLERTVRITQGVIRESGIAAESVAGLFLVGAASRIPLAGTLLHRAVGLAPAATEQPELAVSEGGLNAFALTASGPNAATGTFAMPAVTPGHGPAPSPAQSWQPSPAYSPASLPPQAGPTPPEPTLAMPERQAPPRTFGSWLASGRGIATAAGVFVAVIALVVAVLVINDQRGESGGEASADDSADGGANEGADDGAGGAVDGDDTGGTDDGSDEQQDPAAYYAEEYGDFEPITETGENDAIIDLPEEVTAGVVDVEYESSGNMDMFQVEGLDAENQSSMELNLYAFGGESSLNGAFGIVEIGAVTDKIKVTADGSWTLTVSPIGQSDELTDAASGSGGAVMVYNGDAATWALEHDGSISFSVSQIGDGGLTSTNTWATATGDYDGTAAGEAGPSVLLVAGDGEWTITRQ